MASIFLSGTEMSMLEVMKTMTMSSPKKMGKDWIQIISQHVSGVVRFISNILGADPFDSEQITTFAVITKINEKKL